MEQYRLAKKGCYLMSITMAITSNLSPLLFLTFRDMYDLSYTLLGLLVVINFVTQLSVDLIFTFFTKYFNIHKSVKITALIAFIGLIIYAILPRIFPDTAFLWIAVGTVICSVGSGLAEVLLSPVIAAIPSENPEQEMSKLHSMYAWGVVGVVILSTLFLLVFGNINWMYLALLWSVVPLTAFIIFLKSKLPKMNDFGKNRIKQKYLIKALFYVQYVCSLAVLQNVQWVNGHQDLLKTP